MKQKIDKRIFLGVIIAAAILVFLLIALASTLSNPAQGDAETVDGRLGGLLNSAPFDQLPLLTPEDREAEYELRPELPKIEGTRIEAEVSRGLSTGDYESLNMYLANIVSTYRDSANSENDDWVVYSRKVRNDIALAQSLTEENGKELLASFNTPEGLASALIYAPVSAKYKAFGNGNALVFPAITSQSVYSYAVNLAEKELEADEQETLLAEINEQSSTTYIGIAVYACALYGLPCEIVVLKMDDERWLPYIIKSASGKNYGALDTFDIQSIANSIAATGERLDDVVTYETIVPDTPEGQ